MRQGDVYIVRVEKIPLLEPKRDDKILAHGESTGHKHQILKGQVYGRAEAPIQYVEIVDPTQLVHEEHNAVNLDPGSYMVFRQREHDPFAQLDRQVQD